MSNGSSIAPARPEQERLSDTSELPTEGELHEMVYGDEVLKAKTPTEEIGLLGRITTVEALMGEIDTSFVAPLHSSNNTYTMPSGDE